jgi:hypothetical protein
MDDPTPDAFLEAFPESIRAAAHRLRVIVRRVVPDALEATRPGWRLLGYRVPAGRRAAYFAFIAPEPVHVHLGFEYGALLDDPQGLLGGTELRQVRFFTFREPDDIRDDLIEPFVRQAAEIAALGRAGRLALALDRDG